jgi:uncharacterized repeat protein (TIGR03843 family)
VRPPQRLPELTSAIDGPLGLLRTGTLEIVGRLTEASNVTLYCELQPEPRLKLESEARPEPEPMHCVYKPIRGERPLDDFAIGTLAYREVAAYELSQETGWRIVPPTVLRDGPLGEGMVQAWIEIDEDADIVEMILTRDPRLRRMALFDAIVNNADRKGGHVLPTDDGHLHGCDHGVCFAVEPKLRTVLWGWRGEPLTDEEVACLKTLRGSIDGDMGRRLADLLSGPEVAATARRLDRLLSERKMPLPDPYRPAIPWPPF